MKIKLLDTFSGVGGFHLALKQSIGKENVTCIGYSEIDKFAKQVYDERFPGTKDLGSISELDIDGLEDFDLLTGGFPCQDVSVAGKQNLEGGGRTILVEYLLQILEKKKPKYFIFENVKGLMSKKFNTFRESIFDRIWDAGYVFSHKILNTKDFGLPQNRERVFIVGEYVGDYPARQHHFKFPEGKELPIFLKDILEEKVDEKYYMTEEQLKGLEKYESNNRRYSIFGISPTLNTSQGGHRQVKVAYSPRTREFGVTGWRTKCVPSLCARDYKDPKYMEENNVIRKLIPREYEKLQGFEPGWSSNIVSNSQTYKQMGNAISVPVAKSIFDNLIGLD